MKMDRSESAPALITNGCDFYLVSTLVMKCHNLVHSCVMDMWAWLKYPPQILIAN